MIRKDIIKSVFKSFLTLLTTPHSPSLLLRVSIISLSSVDHLFIPFLLFSRPSTLTKICLNAVSEINLKQSCLWVTFFKLNPRDSNDRLHVNLIGSAIIHVQLMPLSVPLMYFFVSVSLYLRLL